MKETNAISQENKNYWAKRSSGYSDVNKEELAGESRAKWKEVIGRQLSSHFGDRPAADISVLDVGTGPGFFAIILTELGYRVTAADFSPEMLSEAGQNAGSLADSIDFREMDAMSLGFPDSSFDAVISRNLTWNLPRPDAAYREWCRVLKPGGILINFDSNWYSYLFDDAARKAFEADRAASEDLGLGDQNVGDSFDVMEDIARMMPLSRIKRPAWDIDVLSGLEMKVTSDTGIWKEVWTLQEQVNFASTPMFMINAVK